jgi:hypothetical protein
MVYTKIINFPKIFCASRLSQLSILVDFFVFIVVFDPFKLILTANEGPMRIKYKCLVPIYVFPELKLRDLIISKTDL